MLYTHEKSSFDTNIKALGSLHNVRWINLILHIFSSYFSMFVSSASKRPATCHCSRNKATCRCYFFMMPMRACVETHSGPTSTQPTVKCTSRRTRGVGFNLAEEKFKTRVQQPEQDHGNNHVVLSPQSDKSDPHSIRAHMSWLLLCSLSFWVPPTLLPLVRQTKSANGYLF